MNIQFNLIKMPPFNTYPVKDQIIHLYIALIPVYIMACLLCIVLIFKCCECMCSSECCCCDSILDTKAPVKPPSYVQIQT